MERGDAARLLRGHGGCDDRHDRGAGNPGRRDIRTALPMTAADNYHYDKLTFAKVSSANLQRCQKWHPGFPGDDEWSGADWSNAMCGEAGEAANVVKKLRRYECGLRGELDPEPDELRAM